MNSIIERIKPFLIGFLAGAALIWFFRPYAVEPKAGKDKEAPAQIWTCSMHPQIQMPKPGKCPICGMDLIPLKKNNERENPRQILLSDAARKLANISTQPVEKKFVSHEVFMVGKIAYDETRLKTISARIPGRVDLLFVNYTGIPVRAGDHVAKLYSEELLSAQEELLQAAESWASLGDGASAQAKEMAKSLLSAAREKLRLWGFSEEQVGEILKLKKTVDHLTITAPISGIVVEKHVKEGMYIDTGMPLFTIADLSEVWVKLNAYEMDLIWLRYGQEVKLAVEANPGETFSGRIIFIDPVLDDMTRSVKMRVHVSNPSGLLKPEMFVRAFVSAKLTSDGKVLEPNLSGKWISPMHPEIIRDEPGTCDVCGMPLVRAETLGYAGQDASAPLVVPISAPLITGRRAVVYVQQENTPGLYELRVVELGPRAGNYYIVKEGLSEGESVVVNGAFKIDSSSQIAGKFSMMRPEPKDETSPMNLKSSDEFQAGFNAVLDAYDALRATLSNDALHPAHAAVSDLKETFEKIPMPVLSGPAHELWMKNRKHLMNSLDKISKAKNLQELRGEFALLSESMIESSKTFSPKELFVLRCPMAFDNRGAVWLQMNREVSNPYFGSAMPRCGEVVESIKPVKEK